MLIADFWPLLEHLLTGYSVFDWALRSGHSPSEVNLPQPTPHPPTPRRPGPSWGPFAIWLLRLCWNIITDNGALRAKPSTASDQYILWGRAFFQVKLQPQNLMLES